MDGYKRMLWTVGLVFAVTVAQEFINAGGDIFNVDMLTVRSIVGAGIGAVLALLINFAAPWIKQYGYTGAASGE